MHNPIPEDKLCGGQQLAVGPRRQFMKAAGAAALTTAGLPAALALAAEAPAVDALPIRIGIFTKTFSHPTLEATLDAVRALGLDCVQLNLESAGLKPMPDEIPADVAQRIREAAAARGITLSSVQGTFNMSHPDADYRRAGLRRMKVLTAACRGLGTSMIGICIGTRDRQNMWRHHPDNRTPEAWRDMTACVGEAVKMAADAGVVLGVETEVSNVVNSAQAARRLLDEIGSPHLKITMDAANLFPAGALAHQADVLDKAFALLGPDIVMAHAKDISQDGEAGHEAAGHGRLDYDRYMRLLLGAKFKGPLLLHGLTPAQAPGCVAFLREKIAHAAAKA